MNQQKLEGLIAEYKKQIPAKIKRLEELKESLKDKPSLETLQTLRLEIHKIAGSAALYGFVQVSSLCKEEEFRLLEQLKDTTAQSCLLKKDFFQNLELFMEKIIAGFSHDS